jgi:hypothetical protein
MRVVEVRGTDDPGVLHLVALARSLASAPACALHALTTPLPPSLQSPSHKRNSALVRQGGADLLRLMEWVYFLDSVLV